MKPKPNLDIEVNIENHTVKFTDGIKSINVTIDRFDNSLLETNDELFITASADAMIAFLTESEVTKVERELNFDTVFKTALDILLIDIDQMVQHAIDECTTTKIFLC